MADVEALLIKAQNVMDADLTGMILKAEELKAGIVKALQCVPKGE
jgi:hypothetical protein